MTREDAIFILECVEAHGIANDAKKCAIEALKAEPIVRCKDCKWIDLCKDPEHYEYKGANGFCSKGERKNEAGNGI